MTRLKIVRSLLDLKISELSRATGVDKPAIWRYEKGAINPDTPRGRAVCRVLGIDPDWAFGDWREVTS